MGNLGKDPELKQAGGIAICNFSVAVSKSWKDDAGEKHQETEWFSVVAFRKTAEFAAKYLNKGRAVLVEGEMKTRSWEKDGQKHYRTELVAREIRFAGSSADRSAGADTPAALDPTFAPDDDIGAKIKSLPNEADKLRFDPNEPLPF
jgi:single-strand DNA-binding protein